MRNKVIKRLKELFSQQEGMVGSEEYLTFPMPDTAEEIDELTDEQLIELLETNGMFEG